MPAWYHLLVFLRLAVLLLIPQDVFHVTAAFRNFTIDDSDSSWVYGPYGAWNVGNQCRGCDAQPNATLAYNNTWHDAAFYAPPNQQTMADPNVPFTANITFNGTAVYVFCIMLNSATYPIFGNSDMIFYMDDVLVSTYQNTPTQNLDTYTYNVPVFVMPSLESGLHYLMIQNGVANGTNSLILLDYIVYTYVNLRTYAALLLNANIRTDDISSSSSPASSPTATEPRIPHSSSNPSNSSSFSPSSDQESSHKSLEIKIGVTIGIVLLLGAISFLLWRRRRLHRLQIQHRLSQVRPTYLYNAEFGYSQPHRAQKHRSQAWNNPVSDTSFSSEFPCDDMLNSTTMRIVEASPPAYRATM